MMKLLSWLSPGISCHSAMKVMQSYLDGEVSESKARQVARHLEMCEDCDTESQVFKKIKASLAKPQADLDPVIMQQLAGFTNNLAQHGSD